MSDHADIEFSVCYSNFLTIMYDTKEEVQRAYEIMKEGSKTIYKMEAIQRFIQVTFERYKETLGDVIKVNMQEFLSGTTSIDAMLKRLQKYISAELKAAYREVLYLDEDNFIQVMKDVYAVTNCPFVVLIDEWDCLFREYRHDQESQKKYLDFLRLWLKDQAYVALAYMTGILPIKKYGTHSALNMFSEYSMTNPGAFAEYFGFTEQEVQKLCTEHHMSFEEAKAWYDGYELVTKAQGQEIVHSMYSPKSVVDAMIRQVYDTYWNQTETYEALKAYIQMNLEGLKDDIIRMLAGERVRINTGTFTNDMTTFTGKDDTLTLLVHLGYLSYCWADKTVAIPNKEVSQEYINAISTMDWSEVIPVELNGCKCETERRCCRGDCGSVF